MESPRIRVLDAAVIDHIAAGEVVERPASVVKELVENAFDAGASAVQVDVEGGGLTGITVTDDGMGMTPAEARLCVLRHATSKLRTSDDLFCIKTLGFRGEALSSIASVSHLTITTRRPSARTGFRIELRGGEIVNEQEVGCPRGTSIQVRELFYNTPARRKFMRAPATEQSHVVDAVLRVGMGYRKGGVLLVAGTRRLVDIPDDAQGQQRIAAALGPRVGNLSPLAASQDGVLVEGYVSAPDVDRADTKGMWMFVNGRFVRDRMLQRALLDSYPAGTAGRYPTAIIYVDVDPEAVDVNVHPQKLEVRFADATYVYRALTTALRNVFVAEGGAAAPLDADEDNAALGAGAPHSRVAQGESATFSRGPSDGDGTSGEVSEFSSGGGPPDDVPVFPSTASAWSLGGPRWSAPAVARTDVVPRLESAPEPPRGAFGGLSVWGCVGPFAIVGGKARTYALHTADAARWLAAATLRTELAQGTVTVHPLLFPARVDVPRSLRAHLRDKWERLQPLGFEVEPAGPETFMLKAIPAALLRAEPSSLVNRCLEAVWGTGGVGDDLDAARSWAVLEACLQEVRARADTQDVVALLGGLDRHGVTPDTDAARVWLQPLTPEALARLFS